jgi:hypothetical protein
MEGKMEGKMEGRRGFKRSGPARPRPSTGTSGRGSAGVERPSPQLPGVQDQPGSRHMGREKLGEGKEM